MEISKLYATLDANLAPFRAGLNAAKGLMSKAAGSIGSTLASVGGGLAGGLFGGAAMGVGMEVFNTLSAGAGILGQTIAEAARRGSDLGETLSKTQVLLGDNADGAIKFARAMQAGGKGQVADILESLSGSALAMRQMGVETQKAIGYAKRLEERVADVASQDNIDPKEIRENLQSAFAGEYQVLRKYKVFIDAESLKKTGKPMAEAMADAFLKQTQRAQGDFDRTKFSSANLGRTASNSFQTALTTLGEAMAPAVQAFQYLRTVLADVFMDLIKTKDVQAAIASVKDYLIALAAQLKNPSSLIRQTLNFLVGAFSLAVRAVSKFARFLLRIFDGDEGEAAINKLLDDANKAMEESAKDAGKSMPAPAPVPGQASKPHRYALDKLLDDARADRQTGLLAQIADNTKKDKPAGAADVVTKKPDLWKVGVFAT